MWSWHRRGAGAIPVFGRSAFFPQRGEPFPCKGHRRQKENRRMDACVRGVETDII